MSRHAEKNLYRCTSTVLALNYCSRIFFKSFSYLYEEVRTNFSADFFLDLRNFWLQFRENCGATWRRICELSSVSKRAIHSEKKLKTEPKSGNKRQRNACSNYATLERTVLRTQSVTNKQTKTNKHHIFAPTASAHCAISPKLCTVIELDVPIKKCGDHFSIQFIFCPLGGKMLIFGYWVKTIPAGCRFAAPAGNNDTCITNIVTNVISVIRQHLSQPSTLHTY